MIGAGAMPALSAPGSAASCLDWPSRVSRAADAVRMAGLVVELTGSP